MRTNGENSSSNMFHSLKVPASELRLHHTLFCGQVFTWLKRPNTTNRFIGMIDRRHVIELREEENDVQYRVLTTTTDDNKSSSSSSTTTNIENEIRKYFNLDYSMSLPDLHAHFSKCDPKVYARVHSYFPGLRVVRQDPLECLISFICSSNNNVSRITKMIAILCEKYGTFVGELNTDESDNEDTSLKFYAFPTVKQLSRATEKQLRDLSFGYRAKYIVKTVSSLMEKGDDYLLTLRENQSGKTSHEIIDDLAKFQGVGCKVAACVSLYSLDCFDLVPTDVHILRLARMHYTPLLLESSTDEEDDEQLQLLKQSGTMNTKKMKVLMQMFVRIFGEHAGWAQMILYGAQIQSFKKQLPADLREELFVEKDSPKSNKKKKKNSKRKKNESDEEEDSDNSEEDEISTPPKKVAKENLQQVLSSRVTRSRTKKLKELMDDE
jgi:N-glycosylase/DNA lyase